MERGLIQFSLINLKWACKWKKPDRHKHPPTPHPHAHTPTCILTHWPKQTISPPPKEHVPQLVCLCV